MPVQSQLPHILRKYEVLAERIPKPSVQAPPPLVSQQKAGCMDWLSALCAEDFSRSPTAMSQAVAVCLPRSQKWG